MGRKPCVTCGREDTRKGAFGLCHKCYERERYRRRKQTDYPRWSVGYDACIDCGTTRLPHAAYGQCKSCRSKRVYNPHSQRSNIHRYAMKKKYGITAKRFAEMFAAQNGVCAICQKAETKQLRFNNAEVVTARLSVDHDHESKKVRGLLCSRCNRALGFFDEDPKRIRAAAIYIEEHREIQRREKEVAEAEKEGQVLN